MGEKLTGGKHWVLLSDRPEEPPPPEPSLAPGKQRIELTVERREFGKLVTVVGNLVLDARRRKSLARGLKRATGRGGTVTPSSVELQGDCAEKARDWLETRGWGVR